MRGPVCILAGAGSGKTTTITRRIAYQVASGTFRADEILAVTFTDKAAGELRGRLETLGVRGVRGRTFHASALAQLTHLVPATGSILPSKAPLLASIVRGLHRAYRFRPLAEFANEIEWAKNRRLSCDGYLEGLGGHEPPVPPDLMARVYRRYERAKDAAGRLDFEDVLEHLARHYESHPADAERLRSRCRALTVDEYQDVNLLQQTLLDIWVGERDDLCVVGDDYQAIYSFTGASADHLLSMPRRFPDAAVIRLESNYRSTPEILELANRLVPALGGSSKRLRAAQPAGPAPELCPQATAPAELELVVERIRDLAAAGVPFEEVAVLLRVNARSDDLEGPLARAGIPYQVRGGAFLERPAARAVLRLLRRSPGAPAGEEVRRAAEAAGLLEEVPEGLGEEGVTFQLDLQRLVALAAEPGDSVGSVADFVEDLRRRFAPEGGGRGVQLLTYHRAKGLEFDAVLLPFLQEGELPIRHAKSAEALAEERRLLYVGLTRARRWLVLSWVEDARRSRFLEELGAVPGRARRRSSSPQGGGASESPLDEADPLVAALRAWRRERSRTDAVPAYVVFHDSTLTAIAESRPATLADLSAVPGVGPAKLERYGNEVLAVLGGASAGGS